MSQRYSLRMQPYSTDYVYVHVHPQRPNEVVYVGRGSGSRAWSIGGRKTQDHRVWLREWAAQGYSPDQWVRIVSRGLTPAKAIDQEKKLIAWHVNRRDSLFNIQGNKKELIRRHKNKFFPEGPQRYRRDKPPVQHFENPENTRHANIFREGKNRYKLVLIQLGVSNTPPAFQSGLTLEVAEQRAKEFTGTSND
jgi:hypothetical protein